MSFNNIDTQLLLKLISHSGYIGHSAADVFISFIIINDRNILIERKMMFMIFTNILLRTI